MTEAQTHELDYFPADPRPSGLESAANEGAVVLSVMCAALPIVGIVLQNGPLAVVGFTLAPAIGLLLSLVAILSRKTPRSYRAGAITAAVLNGAVLAMTFYAIFIHGIC